MSGRRAHLRSIFGAPSYGIMEQALNCKNKKHTPENKWKMESRKVNAETNVTAISSLYVYTKLLPSNNHSRTARKQAETNSLLPLNWATAILPRNLTSRVVLCCVIRNLHTRKHSLIKPGVANLPPAIREGILCGPQGSHTHTKKKYFKSMLK